MSQQPVEPRSRSRLALKIAVLGIVLLALAVFWSADDHGADADRALGKAWPADQRVSFDEIDHAAWDAVLGGYVNSDGLVDYRGLLASDEDRARIGDYLDQLSRADVAKLASGRAKLAFWVNAYNAVTVAGILREYPTTSIKNHTGIIGYNIWDDLLLRVGDESYSLNAIEHEILRKLGEPRIHFAIVCASIGCPRLLDEAYTAERLEEQLAGNARHFFAQRRNFRADEQSNSLYLSSILDWFGSDFGENLAAQLATISPYYPDDASRTLADSGNANVRFLDYDWLLNEQK